jgi:uncharacterized protein (DUF1501 family)
MLSRRDFLKRSSLLAVAPLVPGFVARTAAAAEPGKDTILILIEMTGGNDGLNTVVPYADDVYQKARPTLAFNQSQVIKIDDYLGLHPALQSLNPLLQKGAVAIIQGVGYPNPDRSHFESMDRWQAGQVTVPPKDSATGWLARSVPFLAKSEGVPVMHVGSEKLPLACRGTSQGVFTLNQDQPFELKLGPPGSELERGRKKLLAEVSGAESSLSESAELLPFVQRRHLQTYMSVEKLKEVLKKSNDPNGFNGFPANSLMAKMNLVASLIEKGFGTRVFYMALDGFDTHSGQAATQQQLLQQLGDSIGMLFNRLERTGDDKRTLVMTFSEFGRRVFENGSKGTDHGSGSCQFVVGPAVKGGPCGKHPSLTDLDEGDLKQHTDFRRVYATVLDHWLACDSKTVLGGQHEHLDFLKSRG